jgi:hypothetical protein
MKDEIFRQRHKANDGHPESFAEEHARRARETIDILVSLGEHSLQVMQGDWVLVLSAYIRLCLASLANVVLSWYFWCHAK